MIFVSVLLFCLLSVEAAVPCSSNPSPSSPCVSSPTSATAVALQFYEPFTSGNQSVYNTILDLNWVDEPLNPGQTVGRCPFFGVIDFFQASFGPLAIQVIETIVEKKDTKFKVVVRGVASGNYIGNGLFFGLPAANQPFTYRFVDVHTVKCGVITHTQHLEDLLGVALQVGACAHQLQCGKK